MYSKLMHKIEENKDYQTKMLVEKLNLTERLVTLEELLFSILGERRNNMSITVAWKQPFKYLFCAHEDLRCKGYLEQQELVGYLAKCALALYERIDGIVVEPVFSTTFLPVKKKLMPFIGECWASEHPSHEKMFDFIVQRLLKSGNREREMVTAAVKTHTNKRFPVARAMTCYLRLYDDIYAPTEKLNYSDHNGNKVSEAMHHLALCFTRNTSYRYKANIFRSILKATNPKKATA
jgi:hypothetical protein